jgi:KDO2-lipid IV(A) lauroyltransferase
MKFLSALLFYLVIIPISLLPFPVLYLVSDFTFIVLYYLFPYRKKIVFQNLRNSFPEKTDDEIKTIAKKFYLHFCDLIFESLKIFTAGKQSILKRVELVNTELLQEYYKHGKSVILATGHYGNWEWPAVTLPYHSSHTGTGIYQKLSNDFFDLQLRKTRARFGMKLMSTKEVASFFESHKDDLCTYGFINDQSPSDPKKGHWMNFLNQQTCMFLGVEKYAVKYNYPVIYGKITKVKRGYYRITYELIDDQPALSFPFKITEACARINEDLIRKAPQYWLWTHRRWKHSKSY